MSESTVNINLVLENKKVFPVPYTDSTTAEDVCIFVCKHLNIKTITRHLFALRVNGKYIFLMPNALIKDVTTSLDFRIRYKVAHTSKLKKFDQVAYNYYFEQARIDVMENRVPDLIYEKHRSELLGLGLTDMYRVILEKGISRDIVVSEYKKYIPRDVLKKHAFFIKKPIHDHLVELEKRLQKKSIDASYVKAQYINQLDVIAPEYLSETYKAVTDLDGHLASIIIKVTPPHVREAGIKYCLDVKKDQWVVMCTIEELGFISIRDDGAIEISRLNGIPINLKFPTKPVMWSFVTLLDGYYRLTCKWTFNLCQELETPSLKKLHFMKCHGPVGGLFSYAKLEAKTQNRFGCFIIRECETCYNTYYIDVCVKDSSKPKTFKLERIIDDEFIFHEDVVRYRGIQHLIHTYSDPEGAIYLKECIPPSEYDISPLLLCRSDNLVGDALTDSSSLAQLVPEGPVCINYKDLQVYKGLEYSGDISKTESNVRCQAWTSNSPHKVDESLGDDKFPFQSKKMSKNYCRNPDKKSMGPWCYTMNDDLIDETCSIPLCSYSECRLTGPGMEYGGSHHKGVSDRQCLKWDKERKKVLVKGNYTKYGKFAANLFPDSSVSKAKKFCRNPDGDMGGPWCFVENDELGYVEREYCDIPFCFDPECSVFAKNYDTYMHYTDFNGSALTDIKFGIKLWDSDSVYEASARLVLSVLALPLTGQEIGDLGIGIEIFISNKESALRYGNKDKPEYEPTPGILTSTNFTTFTLNWDRGFITFGIEGQIKPIFLAEMKTKNNLMGFQKDRFDFYSVQGTNTVWSFPFCLDDDGCDVQTTTRGQFQQFWPLRQKDVVFDLYVYVRAFRSASILITPSPTVDFPYFKIVFLGPNGFTRVTIKEYPGASEVVLKEIQLDGIVDYWSWGEFSISFFANSLQIYMKKVAGMHSLLEATNEIFRAMRWFSVSSENTVAHWSFYCQPPAFAQPPMALLPECAINTNEPDYTGTQDITSAGLPCLPWSGKKLLPDDMATLFKNESSILSSKNYCRDPGSQSEGTFCYALTRVPTKKVEKAYCHLRKCKSQQCKMAGTGNDFIGHLAVTRSGRRCDAWDVFPESVHPQYMYSFNGSYFAEMNSRDAKNYCRNPNRDISALDSDSKLIGQLAEAVHARPALWDHTLPLKVRGKDVKERLWREVHKELKGQIPLPQLEKKWRNLRDTFLKHLKTYTPSGSGATKKKWIHFDVLFFLAEKSMPRKTYSNVEGIIKDGPSTVSPGPSSHGSISAEETEIEGAPLRKCRKKSGSWCYTTDPQVVQDVCNVKDCDRPEELIVIISTSEKGRKLYILPQWKEEGIHGGLRFSLKEWNPDLLSGIVFAIYPKDGSAELMLVIGAALNEKVQLYLDGKLIDSKTLPHLIAAGVWTDFWLQMRKGELMFGFKGVPTALFEWRAEDMKKAFEPMFVSYYSLYNQMPIGIFFQKDECHTENTTDNNFLKFFPVGLYSEAENVVYTNLSFKMRGMGQAWISLMWVTNNLNSYQIKIDTDNGILALYKIDTLPRGTEPMLHLLMEKQISHIMTTSNWTKFYITWTERIFDIKRNSDLLLHYESDQPILVYWFSVAAVVGWVTWSANCEPLDLDGPPIDGGWSAWSPWTCTVSCGGGQGFRTRTCSNPHPNIFGKLCEGNPTATGVCNDFPCGDISPDTLDKIREKLKSKAYSFIIDEDRPILLMNDREMLKVVKKESPEAYFEWTLNGVFINVDDRVSFLGDDIMIKAAKPQDAGTYVCMIYRINDRRVILKVIILAVRAKKFDVDTRATLSYTLQCHSVILGYVYADLSLKLTLNNKTFLDHGLTTLAAVNVHVLNPLNRSDSGDWNCVVEQKDLKLKWITNYVKLNVKKKPNFYTHLMEDKLTAPFFGLFKSEEAVLGAVIFITVLVFIAVVVFLFLYFKFCTLQSRYKRNRRL